MEEEKESQFVLREDDRSRSMRGHRSNGQKRQFYPTEGAVGNPARLNEGTVAVAPSDAKKYLPDAGEKENNPAGDNVQKVSAAEGQVGCLLEKSKDGSADKEAHPSTPRRGAMTPPQTPPRHTRTPQGKPPPYSPTPNKGGVPRTPKRRMVHEPYRLPCTPPVRTPASPLPRASPKPRSPSRTRTMIALLNQNTPSPGLSSQFSTTPQTHPRLTLAETPSSSASPVRYESCSPSPITATQFLQFNAVAEHHPPSLQPTSPYFEAREAQLQLFGCGSQYATMSPLTCVAQYTPQGLQYAQRAANSPLFLDQSPQYFSPASRHFSSLATSSPRAPAQALPMQMATGRYIGSPTASQQVVPYTIFVLVEFKRERIVQYQSNFQPPLGGYVVVEGDEGEDIGRVVNTWTDLANSLPVVNNSLNSNKASSGRDVDPVTGDHIYPQVLRGATSKEVQHRLYTQAEAEARCAEVARNKVFEHNLPMDIIEAEYQFDRKKLTFYYDAPERVDFRDLLRDLFKLYRARIWMSKVRHQEGYDGRRAR